MAGGAGSGPMTGRPLRSPRKTALRPSSSSGSVDFRAMGVSEKGGSLLACCQAPAAGAGRRRLFLQLCDALFLLSDGFVQAAGQLRLALKPGGSIAQRRSEQADPVGGGLAG